MHSLEMIVFLNSKRQSARAHRAARLFNSGETGKTAEKTGAAASRQDWITDEEWEARKKKKKRRAGY